VYTIYGWGYDGVVPEVVLINFGVGLVLCCISDIRVVYTHAHTHAHTNKSLNPKPMYPNLAAHKKHG
jgi:hypothetical protein